MTSFERMSLRSSRTPASDMSGKGCVTAMGEMPASAGRPMSAMVNFEEGGV